MKLNIFKLQTLCSYNNACNMVLVALQSLSSLVSPHENTSQPASQAPLFIPAVHSYEVVGNDVFHVASKLYIVVDEDCASSAKDDGPTLIPPTVTDFAHTFASDYQELFPTSSASVALGSESSLSNLTNYVFLTLAHNSNNTLADGSSTSEGYSMEVTASGVKISASGAKGIFWGTRTFLQGLVSAGGRFPASVINDQPDWRTRGLMLGPSAALFARALFSCHSR